MANNKVNPYFDEFQVHRSSISLAMQSPEVKKQLDKRGLRGDYLNLCVLIFLYILQGLPLGILSTVPMILATNKIRYEKQAIFSFAGYPYAIKLLWAPFVDALYCKKFGRRKSWLIPVQFLIGTLMIVISSFTEDLIYSGKVNEKIWYITVWFFVLIFLTATQDICVDAWALTLLSKRNVHYAPSCNVVGVILGSFISRTVFLALESADFCNKWIRKVPQTRGIVSLESFMFGTGVAFIVLTTLILIFKKETDSCEDQDEFGSPGIFKTYAMLFQILMLPSVKVLAVVLLSEHIGHCVVDTVNHLKLIQFGVKRENLSMLGVPITVLNLFLPFFIAKKTEKKPLHVYWRASMLRLFTGSIVVSITIWTQTKMSNPSGEFPVYYYIVLFAGLTIHDIVMFAMGMTIWAFKTRISDPKIGGTYMTLMTTLHNLGKHWLHTISLWLVDHLALTWDPVTRSFSLKGPKIVTPHHSRNDTHSNTTDVYAEEKTGVVIDGYYVEYVLSLLLGIIWIILFRNILRKMQMWPESAWRKGGTTKPAPEVTKF